MRGNSLRQQRRASLGCRLNVLFEDIRDAPPTQWLTTSIDEDLRNENASTDTEPGPQSGGRIFQERQHSLLASFATDKDARCGLKCQVVNAQADELGDSQSSGDGEVK